MLGEENLAQLRATAEKLRPRNEASISAGRDRGADTCLQSKKTSFGDRFMCGENAQLGDCSMCGENARFYCHSEKTKLCESCDYRVRAPSDHPSGVPLQ